MNQSLLTTSFFSSSLRSSTGGRSWRLSTSHRSSRRPHFIFKLWPTPDEPFPHVRFVGSSFSARARARATKSGPQNQTSTTSSSNLFFPFLLIEKTKKRSWKVDWFWPPATDGRTRHPRHSSLPIGSRPRVDGRDRRNQSWMSCV